MVGSRVESWISKKQGYVMAIDYGVCEVHFDDFTVEDCHETELNVIATVDDELYEEI